MFDGNSKENCTLTKCFNYALKGQLSNAVVIIRNRETQKSNYKCLQAFVVKSVRYEMSSCKCETWRFVFDQITKYICPNHKMYLPKLQKYLSKSKVRDMKWTAASVRPGRCLSPSLLGLSFSSNSCIQSEKLWRTDCRPSSVKIRFWKDKQCTGLVSISYNYSHHLRHHC